MPCFPWSLDPRCSLIPHKEELTRLCSRRKKNQSLALYRRPGVKFSYWQTAVPHGRPVYTSCLSYISLSHGQGQQEPRGNGLPGRITPLLYLTGYTMWETGGLCSSELLFLSGALERKLVSSPFGQTFFLTSSLWVNRFRVYFFLLMIFQLWCITFIMCI